MPAPALMPLISRSLPAYDSGGFGGSNAATNAVDADYSTNWRLVNVPSGGSPQYWALDISGVAGAAKASVVLHWFNDASLSFWDGVSAQSSANFNNLLRDYTLRGHAGAGGGVPPVIGDAGWVTLATVTGNVYRSRQHALTLTGYNWLSFRITAANGAGGNNDVAGQVNVHDIAAGNADNILFLGDSIMSEGMSWRNIGGTPWTNGPLTKQIETRLARYPLYQNGGVPTTASGYGDTNKATLFSGFTGKYAVLGWGANDSSAGVSKATFKANMLSIATYALGTVGCTAVILPKVTKRTTDAPADAFVVQYNAAITELAAADPTHVLVGPDFYAAVNSGTLPLRDGLHPTFVGAGNGYEVMIGMWADWLVANLYPATGVGAATLPALTGAGAGVFAATPFATVLGGTGVWTGVAGAVPNLTVRQGDTVTKFLTVADAGQPTDLTNAAVTFHLRLPNSTTDSLAQSLTLTNAPGGVATLTLTAAQTAALPALRTLRYEVECVDAIGNVTTPVAGLCYIGEDSG